MERFTVSEPLGFPIKLSPKGYLHKHHRTFHIQKRFVGKVRFPLLLYWKVGVARTVREVFVLQLDICRDMYLLFSDPLGRCPYVAFIRQRKQPLGVRTNVRAKLPKSRKVVLTSQQ